MKEKIGNVVLDDSFYTGEDSYSDGDIEDVILEAFRDGTSEQLLRSSRQWAVLYHLSDIRENILEWYPFDSDASLLEIGSGCGALTGLFSRKVKRVTCIELSKKRSLINAERNRGRNNIEIKVGNFKDIKIEEKYDYITLIGVWEYAGLYVGGDEPYIFMLRKIKEYLKTGGKIIVAIENKMGLKYFNGAPEDHTAKMYSGINDYAGEKAARTFSKPEIVKILDEVGIKDVTFYYPAPDYKLPDVIYSDGMLPKAGDLRYYKKDYADCRIYNFNDAAAFDQICTDSMFDYFSNSFLFICGEKEIQVPFSRYNRLRKKQYRMKTCIAADGGRVIKSALHKDAACNIETLLQNEKKWKGTLPGIAYVSGEIINGQYQTSYIEGTNLDVSFYRYRHSAKEMIEKIRCLIQEYLLPEEEQKVPFTMTEGFARVFGEQAPSGEYSLPVTNADLIFSNFKLDPSGKLVNFDYEWVFDFPIPYEYVLWRAVYQLYDKFAAYLRPQMSKDEFVTKAGIKREHLQVYQKMERKFGEYVCGVNREEKYISHYEKSVFTQTIQFK
jgi:2-polyprenyl-3-methyl-5-hydroxy-6-metoxy-1,4-benzoquinol methylase